MSNPTKDQIRAARVKRNLTQSQAADVIGVKLRTWQHYEAGTRAMRSAYWELFLTKLGANNA